MSGEIGGIQITGGFLFVMAIWTALPNVMVFLSLTLKANTNRWANCIVGIVSFLVLGATFWAGEISVRYTFQAIIEGVLIVLIVWQAWNWPKQESVTITSLAILYWEFSLMYEQSNPAR